jgi:hypothetical protein
MSLKDSPQALDACIRECRLRCSRIVPADQRSRVLADRPAQPQPAPPAPAEAPLTEADKKPLYDAIGARFRAWGAFYCPRPTVGCDDAPRGVSGHLTNDVVYATRRSQIPIIQAELACSDSCLMSWKDSPQALDSCIKECRTRCSRGR